MKTGVTKRNSPIAKSLTQAMVRGGYRNITRKRKT